MSFSVDAFQDLERLLVERAARSFPVKGSCTVVSLRTCAKAAIRIWVSRSVSLMRQWLTDRGYPQRLRWREFSLGLVSHSTRNLLGNEGGDGVEPPHPEHFSAEPAVPTIHSAERSTLSAASP